MHPKMHMTPTPHLSKRTVEEYHAPVKPTQQIASIIVIKYNNLELTLEGVSTGDGSDLNTIAELIAASLKMESVVDFELFVLENELLIPMRDQLKEIYSITRQPPTKENEMTQATTQAPTQTAEQIELTNLRAALAAKEAEVASLKAAASAAAATAPQPAPAAAPAAEPTAAATTTAAAPAAAPAAVPAPPAPVATTNDGWSTTTRVVVGVTATGVIAGAGYALWRKFRT